VHIGATCRLRLNCPSSAALQNGWTDRDAVWAVNLGGPKEPCIGWCPDSPWVRQYWRGKGRSVANYRDSVLWAVQQEDRAVAGDYRSMRLTCTERLHLYSSGNAVNRSNTTGTHRNVVQKHFRVAVRVISYCTKLRKNERKTSDVQDAVFKRVCFFQQ